MRKILLIEDDLPLVRMYQVAFKKAEVQLVSALDGEEGLKKTELENPDLILLDLILPKKSGFDVLKELKTSSKLSKIPVVCLSVLHQEEDIRKCKELGAEDFFVKTDILPEAVVSKILGKLGLN